MQYILSIDQGTTSTRAILLDKKGKIFNIAQRELKQRFIGDCVLQNPNEILQSVYDVVKEVLGDSLTLDDVNSVGIANQRETTIIWNKKTGKPVYDAIVWQSKQSKEICDLWIKKGYSKMVHQKTGLKIDPYFSASKIRWIIENEFLEEKAKNGELLFGTVDSWILYNINKNHYTDYTNASRTMLYNIKRLEWDDELLERFGIPKVMLPEVKTSQAEYGDFLVPGVKGKSKVYAIAGDQQASLFGQCAFDYGDIKNTYGTGCFMLMNTKNKFVLARDGLLTTLACSVDGVEYALEGSVFIAGAAVQWLRDGLKIIESASETNAIGERVVSNDVFIVPAFVGLGTPYWDTDARGAIFGLTQSTNRDHLVKAVLQAIAYQTRDVMELMKKLAETDIYSLSVDGGVCANDYLLQFQADLLQASIVRPKCLETTARGVAYLAGLKSGFYKNLVEIKKMHLADRVFRPNHTVEDLYKKWLNAVAATRIFK